MGSHSLGLHRRGRILTLQLGDGWGKRAFDHSTDSAWRRASASQTWIRSAVALPAGADAVTLDRELQVVYTLRCNFHLPELGGEKEGSGL